MASCKLVERLLPLLCLALLPQLAAAMRCRVPYEKVQQNYCYYISDVKQEQVSSQACQAFEWDFSVMSSPFAFCLGQATSFSNLCYQDKRTSRVCLDSAEEMHILADHLYALGYRNGTQFWSAGHRWPGDMRFYWNYFGRARAINYTNWLADEPTPGMGRNCMLLRLQRGQLYMETASCRTRAVDICEQTLTNEPTIMH